MKKSFTTYSRKGYHKAMHCVFETEIDMTCFLKSQGINLKWYNYKIIFKSNYNNSVMIKWTLKG